MSIDLSNEDFQTHAESFKKLEGISVQLELDGLKALILLTQIQLALRHPENRGTTAQLVRRIAVELQQGLISKVPELQVLLEKGWHPEFDIKPDINPDDKPKRITYKDLPLDIQEEILANSLALQYACSALARVTAYPVDYWIEQISKQANEAIDDMPEYAVIQSIENLDQFRKQAK